MSAWTATENKSRPRILALVERRLEAWQALGRDCSRLDEDDTPKAKAELRQLHAKMSKAEDDLAKYAERSRTSVGWLEYWAERSPTRATVAGSDPMTTAGRCDRP
jgi:hypothetical protein